MSLVIDHTQIKLNIVQIYATESILLTSLISRKTVSANDPGLFSWMFLNKDFVYIVFTAETIVRCNNEREKKEQ